MDFYNYELPRLHRSMDLLVENDDSLTICKYCKADLINESKFCTNCGSSVIAGEKISHIPDDFGFHSTMAKVYFYTLVTNMVIILSVIFTSKYLPDIQWIIRDHLYISLIKDDYGLGAGNFFKSLAFAVLILVLGVLISSDYLKKTKMARIGAGVALAGHSSFLIEHLIFGHRSFYIGLPKNSFLHNFPIFESAQPIQDLTTVFIDWGAIIFGLGFAFAFIYNRKLFK